MLGGVIIPVKHKCAKSGCNELVAIGNRYCIKHANYNEREYNQLRSRTNKDYIKFYHSKEWKQLRSLKLINNTLCENCLRSGIITQATTVHHRNDVSSHWSERLDYDNLESLCKSCHEKIYKGRRYS